MTEKIKEFINTIKEKKYADINDIFTSDNVFYNNYKCNLYLYFRISTESQDFGRQILEAYEWLKSKNLTIPLCNIYCDIYTGKKLNRDSYNAVRKKMIENDFILLPEVSRLGRNWDEVKDEWYKLKQDNINVLVMDHELLCATLPNEKEKEMTIEKKFMQELVFIGVLYASCKKIEEVRKTTKGGLEKVKIAGKTLGRPRNEKTNIYTFIKVLEYMIENNVGQNKACIILGYPKATFYADINQVYEKYNSKDYNFLLAKLKEEIKC